MATSIHRGVKQGMTVERIYYAVPALYTQGTSYENRGDAIEAAIAKVEASRAVSDLVPERVTVDERWSFSHPEGKVGLDTVMFREQYPTLASARDALELERKYGSVTA